MRTKGSRNTLIRVTYDDIGELVGVLGNTAKKYAQRGQFDPRDLDSLLSWVNTRRAAQGLPLIGLPDDDNPAVSDDTPTPVEASLAEDTRGRVLAGLVYDPMTGGYRGLDYKENR
jgi:hypothetical protein